MDSPAPRPLLVLDGARIASADALPLSPLSARADGERVGLVGAWEPLFRLLTRTATLVEGKVELGGIPAEQALASGRVAVAPADPVLVGSWTLRRWLTESAALSATRRGSPAAMANELLGRYRFDSLAARRLDSLNEVERRAVGLVHATLGDPELILYERPLARLDAASHQYLAGLLERTAEGRRVIVSVLDPHGREAGLLDRATTTLVLAADHSVTRRDATRSARRAPGAILATVSRRGAEFQAALGTRGLSAQSLGPVEVLSVVLGEAHAKATERFHIAVTAPEHGQAVLDAALEADAPLVEWIDSD
jgi:ABC-type Na+ transport system ATPase subunit NatA